MQYLHNKISKWNSIKVGCEMCGKTFWQEKTLLGERGTKVCSYSCAVDFLDNKGEKDNSMSPDSQSTV